MKKKLSFLMFLAVFMALTSTLVAQTTCQIKIVGEDSYGDGWNDGVLSVVQGGTTVITWAAPNTDHGSGGPFYDSTMVTVSNSPISFVWSEGDYDDEVTIWIYNANGVLLFTVNEPSSGTIFSMANPCSNCFAPSNLHLTSVSSDSASLAWAGDANGNYGILWGTVADVLAGNGTSGTATTNSITFSNLTAGTGYMIMVWTDCGNNETSDTTTFIFSTIADAVNTFPYTTGFEATDDVAWTFINDATNKWFIGSATNNGGTNSLYISNDNGTTNAYTVSSTQFSYAYRPFSITDPGQYAVSFDWKANGESNYDYLRAWIAPASAISSLSAGHTPDGNNSAYNYVYPNPVTPTGWVDLGGKMNLQTSWQTLTATPSLTAGSYVLLFMWANDASSGTTPPAAVDNIVFTQLSCPQPTALTVTGITATDATLTWTAGGSETEWEMSINGGTWESVVSPVLLDTLTANTPYSIRVRAVCGYDDTSFVTAIAFRTMCTLIDSLPYTENFDGVTGATTTSVAVNNLPPCWNYHNVGTSTSYSGYPIVYNSSSYAHSGAQSMRFYTYTTAGTYADQYAILPMTDSTLYPVNALKLDFWMRSTSTSYSSYGIVGVMTNPADASSFVPVQAVYTNASTTYAHHEVLLGTYTGPHGCVVFKFPQPASSYNAGYVDDITLSVAPTCPPLVSHNVAVTASAARITWATDPAFGYAPDSYTVSYGYASDSLVSPTTVTVTDPELVLTGLVDDTAYMVSITPVCTDGSVASEVFTFTTQALPCLEWDTTGFGGPTDTLTVGTPGSSTTNGMPVNTGYNYSYCQHLILASHIATTGPTNFSGIAFDYAYSQPMTHATNCQIYMGNTTRSTFTVSSPADSAFVPYSQLQLVYSGPLNCTTNGYNYFEFNQGAFAYDGTSNIIVAIVDNSGSYDGTSYVFRYETTSGAAMTHRVYNNTTPYGPTEMDAARANQSYWRTNMKLVTGGGACVASATCYAPAVAVEPDTAGNIEVSWIPGYQETSWNLDYKAAGDTTWTNALTGTSQTSHTFLLSSLLANTNYTFRVTPNCTDTVLFGTASYRTPCGLMSVPFTENFDGMTGSTATSPVPAGYLPSCWDIYNDGTRTNYQHAPYVYNSTTYSHSGNNCIRFYSYNSSGDSNQYLILPVVDTTLFPVNTLQLSFWLRGNSTSSNYFANVVVGVMTDPTVESSFIPYDTINYASTTYANFDVNFNHYTGPQGRITMLFPKPLSSSQYEYGYVDDITLGLIPACPHVTDLAVDMVTNDSVQISWAAGGNETEWSVSSDGTTWTSSYDTTYIFSGLTSNTLYTFHVRPVCGVGDTGYSQNISVRTACTAASIPYTEDFESYSSGSAASISSCWVKGTNSTTAYPYPSTTAITGSRSLYFYGYHPSSASSTSIYSYAALPAFQVPLDSLQLDFKVRTYSSAYNYYTTYLVVGVMTNPNDINTFVGVDTINLFGAAASSVHDISVTFGNYTGNGQYIAIYDPVPPVFGTSSYNYSYAYVDDITVDYLPTCPKVENTHVTNATTTTITIDWTDVATASEWKVEYTGNGTTNVATVNAHPATLSNLSPATAYTIRVRPVCSVGDTGLWAPSVNAATVCDLITPPYVQDFNAVTATTYSSAGSLPPCWEGYSNGTSAAYMPHVTNGGMYSYSLSGYSLTLTSGSSSYGNVKMVRLPQFSTPVNTLTMSFWMCTESSTNGYLQVGYMTSSDFSSFVSIDSIHASSATVHSGDGVQAATIGVYDTVSFDNAPATAQYIAFKWVYTTSYYSCCIDNVEVLTSGPVCNNPTNLHTTAVSYSSVSVTWSGTDSAEVGIRQGLWDETGATIATVTTNSYTFTGLTPNMQYTIAVRNLCPDDMTSDWVYLSVTTDDLPCFAPTNVQVSNETPSGAKVTWTAGGNETEWVVNVFRSGVVDTNYTVINTPMCNVNGLYSAMTYTVKVGAVCGGIDTMWSETTTFTTTACLPPTNVNAVANGHQAIVTWEGSGANEYHVLWFLQGFTTDGDSVIATNGTTNATIDGLEGGEDYDIYVYAYCDGQRSAQAGQTQLHVTGIDDINTSAINLYPNPANTTVTVDGIEGEALVTIVDMNGRTVFSEKTVSSITIDLGGMAKGAYFVHITGENSSAIRKLIVK